MATLPDIDNIDYFALLGVAHEAGSDEIRGAFHQFARQFHPDLYAVRPPEEKLAAARVYRRATEAYRVLQDPHRRQVYIRELEKGRLRLSPGAGASMQPRSTEEVTSSNPLAAKHINEARIAIQRGDLATAKRQLKSAKIFDSKNEALTKMLADVEEKLGS